MLAAGVAVTLSGVCEQLVWLMLVGTAVSGVGFGATFSGTMRTVLPLAQTDECAELLAGFYVVGYLSFSLPAVLTGLSVPMVGLTVAAYGAVVILMALASTIVVTSLESEALGPSAFANHKPAGLPRPAGALGHEWGAVGKPRIKPSGEASAA